MEPRHPKGLAETSHMIEKRQMKGLETSNAYWSLARREVTGSLSREWGAAVGGGKPGGMSGVAVPGPDPLSLSKGDFVDPCLGDLILILKLPSWLKGLLAFLLRPLVRAQGVEREGWVGGSLWVSSPFSLASLGRACMASSSLQPPPRLLSFSHAL